MKTKPHEDKRRQILGAARKLLVARGYQDVALDDVAKEAGVAKGTLFLYYKSKDELLSSALSDLVDRLGAELDAVARSGKTGRELLEAAARTIVEHFERNRDFMALGRLPGCGGKSAQRRNAKFLENQERLAALVRAASKDLPLHGEPRWLAAFLLGLCRSTMVYQLLHERSDSVETRVQKALEFFLKGASKR